MKIVLLLILGLLLGAGPAQAHKLKVFAAPDGIGISGQAYFAGGAKAVGAPGIVQTPDGTVLEHFITGEDGGFHLAARPGQDVVISVDSGDGHMASTTIAAAGLPAAAAEVKSEAAGIDPMEAAVARQLLPLRQQLDAYEEKVRLHDILGGIGMIFGLFGTAAWIQARRKGP